MRLPAPLLCFAFAFGVWWLQRRGSWLSLPTDHLPTPILIIILAAILYAIGKVCYRQTLRYQGWALISLGLITILSGYLYAHQRASARLDELLNSALDGKVVTLTIAIDRLPEKRIRGYRYDVLVEALHGVEDDEALKNPTSPSLKTIARNAPFPTRIRLSENTDTPLAAGERVKVKAKLYALHGNINLHAFDYEGWLFLNGFGATGTIAERVETLAPLSFSLARWREKLLTRLIASAGNNIDIPEVIAVLGLGVQANLGADEWTLLRQSGTLHLFSISGIHVTLLALLGSGLFGGRYGLWRCLAFLPRMRKLILIIPAHTIAHYTLILTAWAYALMSGMSIATERTVLMLTLSVGLRIIGIRVHWLVVAGYTLLALLIYDPFAVVAPGFWLSFVGVCMVIVLGEHSENNHFDKGVEAYKLLSLWRSLRTTIFHAVKSQVLLSLALTPLLVVFFTEWPSAGIVANLIAVPWISWVMVPLSLLLVAFPFPAGMEWAADLQESFFAFMAYLTHAMPTVAVVAPDGVGLVFAVIGVAWLMLSPALPLRALGLPLLIPLVLSGNTPTINHGEAHVVWLDVGNALSVLVRTQNHMLLYDTGGAWAEQSMANMVIRPFLQGEGIHRVDKMIISHADNDHAGGAVPLLQTLPIDSVMVGDTVFAWPSTHPFSALSHIEQGKAEIDINIAGTKNSVPLTPCPINNWQTWQWDGVRFAAIRAPIDNEEERAILTEWGEATPAMNSEEKPSIAKPKHHNDASCILKIMVGDGDEARAVLLTGDIEKKAQGYLVERFSGDSETSTPHNINLKAHYLLAPHHGSKTSAHSAFFQAVAPDYLIVSGGSRQKQYPTPAMMKAVNEGRTTDINRALYHSWHDGALTLTLSTKSADFSPKPIRQSAPRYWHHAIATPYIWRASIYKEKSD